ncbi:hypothetical protein [Burkholderia cepacia]|uniref:hypothetical protein n=1 Tax=Burkholderia cepacia TaxID=292 RepID=UPI0010FEF247|nr:hypothetical protein [Burkholderia cepacia]MCA8468960.1 hypothetical protein [Burkholderia cepacia]QCY07769.1 hypothetical protein EJ998_33165 [Burkholderia cepacia ATCC 25416]
MDGAARADREAAAHEPITIGQPPLCLCGGRSNVEAAMLGTITIGHQPTANTPDYFPGSSEPCLSSVDSRSSASRTVSSVESHTRFNAS